ncbi:MAG: anthranilate synthase component I [Candidatus Omnitrophota bacterium]
MSHPSKKEFIKLAKKGNLIPIYKEILADIETPVSAFVKIKRSKYAFLLESVEGEEKIARFSFLGDSPSIIFESRDRSIKITKIQNSKGSVKKFITRKDPLEEIKKLMKKYIFVPVKGLPRFCGGFVGYIGYDMVRFFEPRLQKNRSKNIDDLKLPDAVFVLADTMVIFDHLNNKIKVVSCAFIDDKSKNNPEKISDIYNSTVGKIDELINRLRRPINLEVSAIAGRQTKYNLDSNFSKKEFENIVRKAKDYIQKGEIIQTVLSQRFHLKLKTSAFDIYRALRNINPSAYMYFLDFDNLDVIGSSPELLIRCEDRVVQTRPIAGTRHRGKNKTEDKRLAKDLLNDAKEKAEHIMLVDLGRNDLGRVCKKSTVKVNEFMKIEKYSHVMHIVSNVKGILSKNKDIYDLLRATFPAGTVSGAPKIRAMEIIDELENIKRGPYAGCVGYFSFSGNLDTCITIRTIIVKDKNAYIQAGAGIVADSKPEKEYFETVNKAKAQICAIGLAKNFHRKT